ncbi:MAG: winged helix-turn-helix domain-containing protein [Actinomycetota bacterium]|nr:winged helix-turn-helix domain-containing protein [Actinomycetota bacterium]
MWAQESVGSPAPPAAGEFPGPDAAGVLLVCDDPGSREALAAALEAEGYRVHFAAPVRAGLHIGAEFDVAVVDLSIAGPPDLIIGALRARTDMPIMAVAAVTVGEATVLGAYTAGADQCVNGFTRPRELVARVRALLRRSRPRPRAGGEAGTADGCAVDVSRGTAVVTGAEIALTRPECELLEALTRRPGRVVRREELVALGLHAGALDSHVRRLRNKLEAVDGRRRIVVVRGVGFRFDAG